MPLSFTSLQINGVEVIVDRYVPSEKKPRSLPKTRNKRIRKKWVKRYGYVELPPAYMFMGKLLCNQLFYNKILRAQMR